MDFINGAKDSGRIEQFSRNENALVNDTSSVISERNNRTTITITNTSPNVLDVIWIAFGQGKAVVGKGINLRKGETITDSDDAFYKSWKGGISAICETINGQLALMER